MAERYIITVMETSQPIVSKRLSDSKMIDFWLSRQRSPATRSVYKRDMARLGAWSDKTLAETDPFDLEQNWPAL